MTMEYGDYLLQRHGSGARVRRVGAQTLPRLYELVNQHDDPSGELVTMIGLGRRIQRAHHVLVVAAQEPSCDRAPPVSVSHHHLDAVGELAATWLDEIDAQTVTVRVVVNR